MSGFEDRSSSHVFRRCALFVMLMIFPGAFGLDHPQSSPSQDVAGVEFKGRSPAIVPCQLIANAVVLHVKLNGHGPYAVLLDSGAVNFISPQAADEVGLTIGGSEPGFGVGRRTVVAGETEVESLQIGSAVLHGQRFHVISLPYVVEHGFPEPIVGGLGYEMLEQVALRVDFVRKQIAVWNGADFHYRGHGHAVPFVLQQHVPFVTGAVDGIPGEFVIDTGAEDSLSLNTPFVKRNDLVGKYAARLYGFAGEGVGGRENAYFVRVRKLDLGGIAVHSMVTELSQDTSGATSELSVAGIVGIGILKRFNVVFDYRNRVLYLEKNRNYNRPGVFNRAGFAPRITAEGLKVISVFQGSPAGDAGIAPGDLILAINGRPSRALDVPFLYELLRQPPGTLLRVELLHQGIEKNVELRLRELL